VKIFVCITLFQDFSNDFSYGALTKLVSGGIHTVCQAKTISEKNKERN